MVTCFNKYGNKGITMNMKTYSNNYDNIFQQI